MKGLLDPLDLGRTYTSDERDWLGNTKMSQPLCASLLQSDEEDVGEVVFGKVHEQGFRAGLELHPRVLRHALRCSTEPALQTGEALSPM